LVFLPTLSDTQVVHYLGRCILHILLHWSVLYLNNQKHFKTKCFSLAIEEEKVHDQAPLGCILNRTLAASGAETRLSARTEEKVTWVLKPHNSTYLQIEHFL
jgi:hypothetical protein